MSLDSKEVVAPKSRTKTIPVNSHMQALVLKNALSSYTAQMNSLSEDQAAFSFVPKGEITNALKELAERTSDLAYFEQAK